MSDILDKICADKRDHVAACKSEIPLNDIKSRAADGPPTRGFATALGEASADGDYGLIAELKKASPSKGLIREDFAPSVIARAYQAGGATCLSVLTDTPYFQGKNDYLTAARMATNLPIMRKDFMLDPYQVYETRAIGGDCILLIMAALEDSVAAELEELAVELDMDVLVEVHNAEELEQALLLKSNLIGINNRNLKTLDVDLATTETLAPTVPEGRMIIGESGLSSPADLARCAEQGVRCFLIGESLMRQDNVAAATRAILQMPAAAPV